ncbi:MAG TPA: glycosyltransferase family 39 protein [bacterium]|nr:glycosyltransferase family 39 protein [bacterium]
MIAKITKKELIIFFFALIIQSIFLIIFIHLAGEQQILSGDGREYYTLGKNLLTTGQFRLSLAPAGLPESLRTPFYPLFLAFCLFLINQIWFISLMQIFISGLIAVLLYRLSRLFLTGRWQLLPVILYLANPYTWLTSVLAMSEVLYTLFFLLAVYSLFRYLQKNAWSPLVASVFWLAVSILVRPVSYYLFFCYFIFLVIYQIIRSKNSRAIIYIVLIFFTAWSLFIFSWSWRNYRSFDRFQISSIQNYNLYFYNARLAYATVNGIAKDGAKDILRQRAAADLSPLALARNINYEDWRRSLFATDYYQQQAMTILKPHIFSYAKLHFIGTLPFFFDAGWRDVFATLNIDIGQSQSLTLFLTHGDLSAIWHNITQNAVYFLVFALGKIYYLLIFILVLSAGFWAPRRDRLSIWIIYFLILYFATVSSLVANARYRYPVEPLMLIVAVISLANIFSSIGPLSNPSPNAKIK